MSGVRRSSRLSKKVIVEKGQNKNQAEELIGQKRKQPTISTIIRRKPQRQTTINSKKNNSIIINDSKDDDSNSESDEESSNNESGSETVSETESEIESEEYDQPSKRRRITIANKTNKWCDGKQSNAERKQLRMDYHRLTEFAQKNESKILELDNDLFPMLLIKQQVLYDTGLYFYD